MGDIIKLEEITIPDLKKIELDLNRAIAEKCVVELRIEDLPNLHSDSIITTKITGAIIDEKRKILRINAPKNRIMFNYESYNRGANSDDFSKFYFNSKESRLTVCVKFKI